MNIIIAGGGKVGLTLARQLAAEGHNLTIIDRDSRVLESSSEQYDAMAVAGNCAATDTLLKAGIRNANLLIAVTSADEVNLLCCMTAHGLNEKLHTIARIRTPEYAEQVLTMPQVYPLSLTVNPERQAAREMERLLKFPGFLHRDTFAKGRTEIVELRIGSDSPLRNVALSDLPGTVKCKVLVCAVLRAGKAVAPSGNFVLLEGDRLFVTAPTSTLTVLLRNLGIITRRVRKVMLCGGGRVSYYLAQMLERDGIAVTLIDKNPQRCAELAELLPNTTIIRGDCSNQALLESQGMDSCDAVVACTGIDETNMLIALYANRCKVPQVITKVSRGVNTEIADLLNLGSVICPKELCGNDILRYVRAMNKTTGAAVSMHTIADGNAEAVEFLVDETTRNCGKPLKEIRLRPNVLIASITRGVKAELPTGESCFRPGDTVVVVTSGRGVLQQINDIFA